MGPPGGGSTRPARYTPRAPPAGGACNGSPAPPHPRPGQLCARDGPEVLSATDPGSLDCCGRACPCWERPMTGSISLSRSSPGTTVAVALAIAVAALGYFVDVFD